MHLWTLIFSKFKAYGRVEWPKFQTGFRLMFFEIIFYRRLRIGHQKIYFFFRCDKKAQNANVPYHQIKIKITIFFFPNFVISIFSKWRKFRNGQNQNRVIGRLKLVSKGNFYRWSRIWSYTFDIFFADMPKMTRNAKMTFHEFPLSIRLKIWTPLCTPLFGPLRSF